MKDKQITISEMVDRFLGWKLPSDFSPDSGIEFTPPNELYPLVENPEHLWPTGTNLFDATQARALIEYLLSTTQKGANNMELKEQVDEIKLKASRQYQHNDCSGFVYGYDKEIIDEFIANLQEQIAELSKAHTFCDRHNEDDIDFCPNCVIEDMDDAVEALDELIKGMRNCERFHEAFGINGFQRPPGKAEIALTAIHKLKLKDKKPFVDRSHEECAECSKEESEPPVCTGHVAGPSPCSEFTQRFTECK